VFAARLKGGGQARNQTYKNRNRKSEKKYGKVEAELVRARKPLGGKQLECAHSPTRQEQTERAATKRQESAFGQQLTEEPGATCSERQTNGDFAMTRRGARQEQVCNVCADNQQD